MRVTILQVVMAILSLISNTYCRLELRNIEDSLVALNTSSLVPSVNGSCGPTTAYTCTGSRFGSCCSSYDFCGNTTAHCLPSHGCQAAYSECSIQPDNTVTPSVDGLCGGLVTCAGGAFNNACCSAWGFCGYNSTFCLVENGCQEGYGRCQQMTPDGTCGGITDYTCMGSKYGPCCSRHGFCGSTSDYCGHTCQSQAGTCLAPSPNGSCGWDKGYTCRGTNFGDCCSAEGYCGNTTEYCSIAAGCSTRKINDTAVGICGGS